MEAVWPWVLAGAIPLALLARAARRNSSSAQAEPAAARKPIAAMTTRAPDGPRLTIRYTDGQGHRSERVISIRDCRSDGLGGYALDTWCHSAQGERTFLTDRIDEAWKPDTGEIIAQEDLSAWMLTELGRLPAATISECPPGRISTRRPNPPIPAVVEWERKPGDIETFDIHIDEVELAGGRPFAFSGRANRRKSPTDRGWSGRRRFKLRGWDTPEAPIRALYEEGAAEPIPAPARWLVERTAR